MNLLRLADVREPIARIANECSTSTRVRSLANESHRRLVPKGPWVGTRQFYQICISNASCLVWPRQIDTIEAYWFCDTPGSVRNGWYEANINGPGLLDSENSAQHDLIDRDPTPVFDQPDNAVSKLQVYSDVVEGANEYIIISGYDENSNWIRTELTPGNWIDGERILISNAAQLSTNKFTRIVRVIKDATRGPVRVWQYDTALGTAVKQLAYYENDELLPIYRQSLVPGLEDAEGCCTSCTGTDNDCTQSKVTVKVRLRHIDVVNDNDFFLLGNLAAIKLMAMAILKEERNLFEESMAYEQKAIRELQEELASYEGEGQISTVRSENPQTWGGAVLNSVSLGYRLY